MRFCLWLTLMGLGWGLLTACQHHPALFQNATQEARFRDVYLGQPNYTAMALRPYRLDDAYLVDLTGHVAEEQVPLRRAEITVPLGSVIRITAIEDRALRAKVDGYDDVFRLLLATQRGTHADIAKELSALVTPTPPLSQVRLVMQPYIVAQKIVRGMSAREVRMSWGEPDRAQIMPSSASVLEEWIYFDKRLHLYLENGYVTNWRQM
jgi:hypothetical protein